MNEYLKNLKEAKKDLEYAANEFFDDMESTVISDLTFIVGKKQYIVKMNADVWTGLTQIIDTEIEYEQSEYHKRLTELIVDLRRRIEDYHKETADNMDEGFEADTNTMLVLEELQDKIDDIL